MSEQFEKSGGEDLSRGGYRNFIAARRPFPQSGTPAVERSTAGEPDVSTLP